MKDLVSVIILSTIFVRGKMYKDGDKVEVNKREAQELISRGVAADEADVEIEEDTTIPIEKMLKDDLIEYAVKELGLDVNSDMKKQDILDLINEYDNGEE